MDRPRTLAAISAGTFDLLIIGGGITGVGVAREASLRGLRVALVEQGDFASGTSSSSTKLIHGGLRYLKQLDFKLVREAVEERQRLLRMAPHQVRATTFLFPVYRGDPDSLLAVRIGLVVYDLFARMQAAVPHRILRPDEVLEAEPGLRRDPLVGGALYTDGRTDDGRLTLAVARSARQHGAAIANYLRVEQLLRDGHGRLIGARLRDALDDQELDVHATRILAAAGPWADAVRRLDDPAAAPLLRLTKGVHLAVAATRLPLRHAVVMRGRDQRMMFAIPSGSHAYLGTTDTDFEGDPGRASVELDDATYILDAANRSFPRAQLGPADVISTWVGLRPLIRSSTHTNPSAISRDYALFHSPSGLTSVGGGKLTAFRAMASHIVDELFPGTRTPASQSASLAPLPGADEALPTTAELERLADRTGATPDQLQEWLSRYGSDLPRVVAELDPKPSGDALLDWHRAMTRHAVKAEMAQRLEDVYRRRTGLQLFTDDNGRRLLEPLADEMAGLLGWSAARTRAEVAHVLAAIAAMFAWRQGTQAASSLDGHTPHPIHKQTLTEHA